MVSSDRCAKCLMSAVCNMRRVHSPICNACFVRLESFAGETFISIKYRDQIGLGRFCLVGGYWGRGTGVVRRRPGCNASVGALLQKDGLIFRSTTLPRGWLALGITPHGRMDSNACWHARRQLGISELENCLVEKNFVYRLV